MIRALRRRLKEWFPAGGFACFYCGVDSTPILLFLIGLIGSLVLGTVFLGVGFFLKGRFKDTEAPKFDVLKAEREG